MRRSHLEHIIRAAGSIAGDDEIIILGSTSVLAQIPDIPEDVIMSIEADLFPKNKVHMSDVIDGSIGELSPFHQAFGYYAHGVGPETAQNLPRAWKERLIEIRNENTKGITGLCLEIHDLAVGKYVSARPKDYRFVRYLVSKGYVSLDELLVRLNEVDLSQDRKMDIAQKIKTDFAGAEKD